MGKTASEPDVAATVRLHITPLTSATASSILPAGTDLSTVSYHTLATFPEASYGFVDLPADAAAKLKKKLHGATFRGVKVRIEEARAEEWKTRREQDATAEEDGGSKRAKRKRAREQGVLEGFEIGDRSVVRGWTEKVDRGRDGEKKKRKKERGECLFKLVIPPNKADNDTKKDKKMEKKGDELSKEERKAERRERRKKKVVKEFEHLEKFPQFLKISQLDPTRGKESLAAEFIDGIGWVDAKGQVVEAPPPKKEKQKKDKKKKKEKGGKEASEPGGKATPGVVGIADDIEPATDAMDIDDAVSVGSEEVFVDAPDTVGAAPDSIAVAANASCSGSESEEEEEEKAEADSKGSTSIAEPTSEADSDSGSGGSEDEESASTKAPSPPAPAQAKTKQTMSHTSLPPLAIHPLEALYKPAALDSVDAYSAEAPEANTSAFRFGFGGDADDSDDDDDDDAVPITSYRDPGRYRSAAPTPDTAIGTKRFFSPISIAGESVGENLPTAACATSASNASSDAPLLFPHEESRYLNGLSLWQKLPQPAALKPVEEPAQGEEGEAKLITDPVELWKKRFYESRGEWNRDWKRRRKEGLKAKRKRERTGPGGSRANRT